MKRLAEFTALVAILGLCSTAAHAAVIACGDVSAVQGGTATVTVSLALEGEEEIAGTQNDLEFDSDAFAIAPADCVINPAIGPDTDADKELSTSILPGSGGAVRNLVVALDNSNPIPSGALYTCSFHVAETAPVGEYTLTNANVRASNPDGMVVPTTAGNCTVQVREAPTPTPTAECTTSEDCPDGEVCVDGHCVTPTPTPIGYCTDDQDCPEGEVCVDNRCVTATPTRTPIGYCTDDQDCPEGEVCVDNRCVTATPTRTPIGYCTDDQDCPDGQVCVDNSCVTATPTPTPIGYCTDDQDCPDGQVCVSNMCVTPTPRKKSSGGGCSCEIDPAAGGGRGGDLLAVLLPALVLALRWRRRRA